ncbi:hypothetical protein ACFO4E_20535 [Nocardiopsis mangrovi]|uniref:Integral membrane protein n=1 Tax=Nocardiopsis mangrovi TaxID=1179818 RepID=A0ABV9DZC5_9ACTN
MVVAVILACEVMFWVLVVGGLAARYLLRAQRLSTALLLAVPVLDVVLLTVIAVHLQSGGTADFSHGLGALYLGFTVAYGHPMIRWADVRFAHRFAGGPAPVKPPKQGPAAVRREAAGWVRCTVACAIGAAALAALVLWVGDPSRTAALRGSFTPLAVVMFWNTVLAVWGILAARTPRPAHDHPAGADEPAR